MDTQQQLYLEVNTMQLTRDNIYSTADAHLACSRHAGKIYWKIIEVEVALNEKEFLVIKIYAVDIFLNNVCTAIKHILKKTF